MHIEPAIAANRSEFTKHGFAKREALNKLLLLREGKFVLGSRTIRPNLEDAVGRFLPVRRNTLRILCNSLSARLLRASRFGLFGRLIHRTEQDSLRNVGCRQ